MLRTAHVFDFPLTVGEKEDVLRAIEERIEGGRPGGVVSITNTEALYHARRTKVHGDFVRSVNISLCDGVGVVIGGWFWGERINLFHGPEFQLECCRYGESRGWRHFFYGGKEGVADLMVEKMKEQFPEFICAGTYCPPFRELSADEQREIVEMINDAKPDFVWVGLGLPKQERWVAAHRDKLDAPWLSGVGAAFDFHSGAVPWAPRWIRALHLESVYRLILQPRIRVKRYWWSIVFLVEAIVGGICDAAKGRRQGAEGRGQRAEDKAKSD